MNVLQQQGPLPYLLGVPAEQPAAPVLFFLHGHGAGPPMDLRQAMTLHGPLYGEPLRAILETLVERHGADRARAYLTGFSLGGNGVFDLALLQPDVWAALWAVEPTRVPARDPERPVWLSIGQRARQHQGEFVDALGLQALDQDPGDRVYLDEGEDHVGCATRAYRDARIYAWLLARRLGR